MGMLGACNPTFTRADQDNFTVHAGTRGIQPFVAALERRLATSADAEEINSPDSDVYRLIALHAPDVTVVVNPMPDDRCNPNAPRHSTYSDREYRIDVVYETTSPAKRQSARRIVIEAAKEVGQALTPFREC